MNLKQLNIIKQAILNEIEGYEFYKMASEQSNSSEVKDCYLELAEEELLHIKWLNELLNKIKGGREEEITTEFLTKTPSTHIFSWDKLYGKDISIAISVFGIGIQMERSSIEFYLKSMETSELPVAKELFMTLVKWEQSHLEQFSSKYEALKENWWSTQNYSPF